MLAMLSKEPARKYELENEKRFVRPASDSFPKFKMLHTLPYYLVCHDHSIYKP